ncbi:MAG: hypothetical protein E7627_02415 [Ruminococcaceae bacterium]|nr:hypothetical protein [Oscillospiraceae bacterium]
MRIEKVDIGFVEIIENAIIEKIVCRYDGTCTVHFYDKSPQELNVGCSSFHSQYGIPVSDDGTRLFVGSWEKGLCAYDILSGEVLWRFKPGKIRNIFVYSKFLIVSRANTSVIKIDIDTGELLDSIKSGTLEHIFDLGFPYIFADTMLGKHCIIDVEKMVVVKKYSSKIVNPFDCLSLMIRNVTLQDNVIIVSGVEQYPNKLYDAEMRENGKTFSRIIDNNFTSFQCPI